MPKVIKVFGAALDPTDSPAKISIKKAYLNALMTGEKLKSKYLDPYDAFIAESKILKKPMFRKIGNFPIESWLRPKPNLEDFQFMNPLDFRIFLDSNGCKEYSDEIEKFIEQKILPDIPLMIGADHSLTGGILRALSKKYDPENITIIIFDGHFDGIPTNLRLELAKYSKEHKEEVGVLFPELVDSISENIEIPQTLNCGTFLHYLIEEGIIEPRNLIIYGCMDYPREEFKNNQDPRVKNYVDFYLSYEEKGVQFIPNSRDIVEMKKQFTKALESINTPYLYISIDVDVSSLNSVLAARFMEFIGVDEEYLQDATDLLKEVIESKKLELIGFDIMEIEVHFLKSKLKSGKIDRTIEIMDKLLEIIS